MSQKKTWENLKWILLNETSQSEKPTYISNHLTFGNGKTMNTIKKSVVFRGLEGGKKGTEKGGRKGILYFLFNFSALYIPKFVLKK